MEQTNPAGAQQGAQPAHCPSTVTSRSSAAPATSRCASCSRRSTTATATASCPPDTGSSASPARGLDDDGYRDKVRGALATHVAADDLDPAPSTASSAACTTSRSTSRRPTTGTSCTACSDRPGHEDTVRVFYLAGPPSLFGPICGRLDEHRPGRRAGPRGAGEADRPRPRLRPARSTTPSARSSTSRRSSGSTTTSARRACRTCSSPGSPTRFLEPLWNSHWVDHVQITVAESLGVAGRGGYYDHVRRAARHGAEPPAPAALPGRDGAADARRPRVRPRREAQGAPGAASR